MRLRRLLSLLFLLVSIAAADAVPVLSWVTTNGDAGFAGGSATTSSPVTTDADADAIAGSFPAVTLAVGDSITLTGRVNVTGRTGAMPSGQVRWGIFNVSGMPATGSGSGYVGVWAAVPSGGPSDLRSADGSQTNPFSSGASILLASAGDATGDSPQFGTALTFTLAITRLDATQMSAVATLTDHANVLVEWAETTASASPSSFTYNAVGFLLGGATDATSATFGDVEILVSGPPADADGDGMPDFYEEGNGLNPDLDDANDDLDADGRSNLQEYLGADGTPGTGDETIPNNPDSDNDELLDGVESNSGQFVDADDTGTDPLNPDSDGDGFSDGLEVANGTDPTDADSPLGLRLFGIDFNRNDAFSSPSQSGFRVISGSTLQGENAASYAKTIGASAVTVSQPGAIAFEFQGANTDESRAIPGGDTSRSFLVADFLATTEGVIDIHLKDLPAGTYAFRSYHLDTFTGSSLGYAQGTTPDTPNTIEARIGGALQASVQPTALGASGLNTTFINDSQIPTLAFPFTHDGTSSLTIQLLATDSSGAGNFLLVNGFEVYQTSP